MSAPDSMVWAEQFGCYVSQEALDEMEAAWVSALPRCAICGTPCHATAQPKIYLVCSLDCALDLARREDSRD